MMNGKVKLCPHFALHCPAPGLALRHRAPWAGLMHHQVGRCLLLCGGGCHVCPPSLSLSVMQRSLPSNCTGHTLGVLASSHDPESPYAEDVSIRKAAKWCHFSRQQKEALRRAG